jgi:hypothetical protein
MFGLDVRVYMVKVSYGQKPYRRSMMQTWGAEVFASPSTETNAGRAALAEDPDNPGSLGLAISEAVEDAASRKDTNYALGSVLNHVLLHQTVIGLEAKKQFEKAGDYPDMIFAPCGGGSNFGGAAFPFFADKAAGKNVRLVAVEPDSCPTLTRGHYAYDFGDTAKLTPMMLMYTLGHDFMPPGIHAGGLRYHGDSALVSQLYHEKLLEAVAVPQLATFERRRHVRPHRRHHSRARIQPRHRRLHRRGAALQGKRRGEDAVLQPFRPRPLRHGRLRQLLQRQAGRLRLSGRSDPGRTGAFAEGGVSAPPAPGMAGAGSGIRLHVAGKISWRAPSAAASAAAICWPLNSLGISA